MRVQSFSIYRTKPSTFTNNKIGHLFAYIETPIRENQSIFSILFTGVRPCNSFLFLPLFVAVVEKIRPGKSLPDHQYLLACQWNY